MDRSSGKEFDAHLSSSLSWFLSQSLQRLQWMSNPNSDWCFPFLSTTHLSLPPIMFWKFAFLCQSFCSLDGHGQLRVQSVHVQPHFLKINPFPPLRLQQWSVGSLWRLRSGSLVVGPVAVASPSVDTVRSDPAVPDFNAILSIFALRRCSMVLSLLVTSVSALILSLLVPPLLLQDCCSC